MTKPLRKNAVAFHSNRCPGAILFQDEQGDHVKLVIQIAFGVFLGALAAHLVLESWRLSHEEQAKEAESKKIAAEQKASAERMQEARELILRQLQGKAEEDRRRHATNRTR